MMFKATIMRSAIPRNLIKIFMIIAVIVAIGTILLIAGKITYPNSESSNSLTESDFSFLKAGMSYSQISASVGHESDDVGSGLYILIYPVKEGKIILTFSSLEHLDRAVIEYTDGTSRYLTLK